MSSLDNFDGRLLQESGLESSDIPLLVLFILTIVFCCLWGPSFCRNAFWYCGLRQDPFDARRDSSDVIRVSLPNLNMLSIDPALNGQRGPGRGPPMTLWSPMRSMTLEDRREFIENLVVTRRVVKICDDGVEDGEEMRNIGADAEKDAEDPTKSIGTKSEEVKGKALMLEDIVNEDETATLRRVEPCPICLGEYEEGDILCWSQNSRCQHAFHKECAVEWLLRHEECPLCRQNYLSLDGDDGEDDITSQLPPIASADAESDAYAYLRGVQLFQLLSRLQSLADARPNTTIRLEGVELANGQRGNMEIQQATTENTLMDVNGRGLNVRVIRGQNMIEDLRYSNAEEGTSEDASSQRRRHRRRRTRTGNASSTEVPVVTIAQGNADMSQPPPSSGMLESHAMDTTQTASNGHSSGPSSDANVQSSDERDERESN